MFEMFYSRFKFIIFECEVKGIDVSVKISRVVIPVAKVLIGVQYLTYVCGRI